jgi:AP-1 complex subunit beta-1
MSMLFPDVVNCMRTDSVEVKKLVYLYLISYAKSNPDLTIMAVNAFVKDSEHASPLIRALAIRTMGCIRVEKITEYLTPPLKKALRDEDPYVRKTAALCVAKLHDISPTVVRQQGFIDDVRELLSDANPTVVANAVAALNELSEASQRECLEITPSVLSKLLAALNECTEWGQVFILDSLAKYAPADAREAENIIERVTPRLVHQNPAVVLSACKIILMYMEQITTPDTLNAICRKLAPPLVTLAGAAQPEVMYVALRNINLIVQRRPNLLAHKVKVFFCKYNDPIFVKMEKLDIMVKLVNDKNVDAVLYELKEYASEVDVEYVRRAVRTIGACAIKLEVATEKCLKVLLQLIQTKVNYVVQAAIVVIKDIFRRYPNRYESIISSLVAALDSLDEPEAKASMIWIIGEYAERIENAAALLQGFLDSFHEDTTPVQLQLLTATVKLFLKQPEESQDLVQVRNHHDSPPR